MAGYTRKDVTNSIANGEFIDANALDAEFDGVQDAMHSVTGHKHSGLLGEGAPITVLGPTQNLSVSATGVNPNVDAALDLGTPTIRYKNTYASGQVWGGSFYGVNQQSFIAQDTDTAAHPGFCWDLDLDTGMYRPAGNTIGLSTGGTERFLLTNTRAKFSVPIEGDGSFLTNVPAGAFTGQITNASLTGSYTNVVNLTGSGVSTFASFRTANGTAAAPPYSFTNDIDTGMFLVSANTLAFTTGGVERVRITSAGISGNFIGDGSDLTFLSASQLTSGTVPNARLSGAYSGFTNLSGTGDVSFTAFNSALGSAAAPSHTFINDPDTGMYRYGSNTLGFSSGGVETFRLGTNAIFQGEVTASQFNGLGTGITSISSSALPDTAGGRDWVGGRTAGLINNSIGSYAFLRNDSGVGDTMNFGSIYSGGLLTPTSTGLGGSGNVSGNWRCMGQAGPGQATLFLRTS